MVLDKDKKLKVLGVAAGQGALLFPFHVSKCFEVIGNIEPRGVFHTKYEEQWKSNFDNIPFLKEPTEDLRPDIIVSSPDCGASSVMRLSKSKKLGKPQKNKSINLVIDSIKKYRPKMFLVENLPRLLNFISEEDWKNNLPKYDFIFHCTSVMDFGNSQKSRKRLIIIGVHKRHSKNYLKKFEHIFRVNTPKISRNLLEHAPRNGIIPKNKTLAMYDYRKLPKKKNLTVRKIQKLWLGDFSDENKWPIKTAKMKTLPGVYRLDEGTYPLTLRPADRQFRPDGYPLTIQDFRRIMGFPKKFQIYLKNNIKDPDYLYWLNKARYTLAKGSVYEVGLWFKKCILKKSVHS